jgi:peptidyl-prolyl cis-trans isomerase C
MTLGTVLFLLSPRDREHDGRDITIEPDRIDARFRSARARVSHPLSATEKQVAIGELVEEEVLAREALRLGIGVEDPILRARLADRMRATLASTLPKGDIGEDEIAAESARRAAAAPLRVRLDVHYFRKEGTDAHEAAERFAQRPGENREHEDRPPIPDGAWWTEEALARVVGANVAHVAMTTEVGRASAPTTSAWGVWIVVPLERRSASPTELRAEAREEILRQRQAAGIARLVEHARRDYRVQIRTLAGTTLEPESID